MPTLLAPMCRDDQLKLNPKEELRLSRLMADRKKQYGQGVTCCEELQLAFFFDGTNNNADRDRPNHQQSNVARLLDVFPLRQHFPTAYSIYIPGVGTPFPQIGDTGLGMNKTGGLAMAYRAEERIVWALLQALNSIYIHFFPGQLLTEAEQDKVICEDVTSALDGLTIAAALAIPGGLPYLFSSGVIQRRKNIDEKRRNRIKKLTDELWQKIYLKNIGRKPQVKKIRVSIFGFSRGATEARCFANWFIEMCGLQSNGAQMALGGIDVSMDFMGIFDTVASVGLANSSIVADGHMEWADAEQNLRIPSEIKRCVHLVSASEIRRSFPLDSISVGSSMNEAWNEYVYPGVHSDVGGGYAPTEQGRGLSPTGGDMLSRVALGHMYREARLAGVPLDVNGPSASEKAKQAMQVAPVLRTAFNCYLAQCTVGKDKPARLEQILWEQTCLYVRWRKLRLHDMQSIPSVKRCIPRDMADILSANDELKDEIARLSRGDNGTPFIDAWIENNKDNWSGQIASFIKPALQPLIQHIAKMRRDDWEKLRPIWEGKAPYQGQLHPDISNLFDEFVHDSRAWFKPFGTDDMEWEEQKIKEAKARRQRMQKRAEELEQRLALQKTLEKSNPNALSRHGVFSSVPLSPEEKAQLAKYKEELTKPFSWELQKSGREPFDLGGGYMRLRRVYKGFDEYIDALKYDKKKELLSAIESSKQIPMNKYILRRLVEQM